jgi:hypothetical protein
MKSLSLIALLFTGVSAFACPDLSGNYTCTLNAGALDLAITQSEANGVTTYVFNGQPIVADGQQFMMQDQADGSIKNQSLTYSCDATQLRSVYSGDFYEAGALQGTLVFDDSYTKDANGALVITEGGTATDATGASYDLEVLSTTCTPK